MKVSDVMSSPVFSASQDSTVEDGAKLMCEKKVSVLPIVDGDNTLVGILTESDFVGKDANIPHTPVRVKQLLGEIHNFTDVEEIYRKAKSKPLKEVMSTNVKSVDKESDLNGLLDMMNRFNLKRVPVVDGGKLVGIITRKDLIGAFLKA